MLSRWLGGLSFTVLTWTGLAAALASPPAGGVYAIINAAAPDQYEIAEMALRQPGVDGLLIHLRWNEISKTKMQYDWSALDEAAALAVAASKRFELGIVTGGAMPGWIAAPSPAGLGAQHATFAIEAADGCTRFVTAPPYDPRYLAAFRDLLRQLAAHLRQTGAYDSLALLKLDGITTTTDELRLPALGVCGLDTVQEWIHLGYTPGKVRGAWDQMLHAYLDNFPDKSFSIGFIGINAFPGITPTGQAATTEAQAEALSARLAATLIADAGTLMPNHVALGFDSLIFHVPPTNLSYGRIEQAFFADAAAAGVRLGWQTNELLGEWPKGGAACGQTETGAVPCQNAGEFQAMLRSAIYQPNGFGYTAPAMQAVYLELFPQNVIDWPGATLAARQNLGVWNAN